MKIPGTSIGGAPRIKMPSVGGQSMPSGPRFSSLPQSRPKIPSTPRLNAPLKSPMLTSEGTGKSLFTSHSGVGGVGSGLNSVRRPKI